MPFPRRACPRVFSRMSSCSTGERRGDSWFAYLRHRRGLPVRLSATNHQFHEAGERSKNNL
ncbi:hypothetical protein BJV74DRAFT_863192 [Russula compacta]|nr:hypothetical protein BJV74DRAFT_863192 [Russula compacta]